MSAHAEPEARSVDRGHDGLGGVSAINRAATPNDAFDIDTDAPELTGISAGGGRDGSRSHARLGSLPRSRPGRNDRERKHHK
jgi:hypothetical protein